MSDNVRAVNLPSARHFRFAVATAACAVLLTACGGDGGGPTNQLGFPEGAYAPGEGLTSIETIALFVIAPLTLLLVVAALVWLPGVVRSNRYRPGRGWDASPLWFGGPPDPAAAVESAQAGDMVRGGASGSW